MGPLSVPQHVIPLHPQQIWASTVPEQHGSGTGGGGYMGGAHSERQGVAVPLSGLETTVPHRLGSHAVIHLQTQTSADTRTYPGPLRRSAPKVAHPGGPPASSAPHNGGPQGALHRARPLERSPGRDGGSPHPTTATTTTHTPLPSPQALPDGIFLGAGRFSITRTSKPWQHGPSACVDQALVMELFRKRGGRGGALGGVKTGCKASSSSLTSPKPRLGSRYRFRGWAGVRMPPSCSRSLLCKPLIAGALPRPSWQTPSLPLPDVPQTVHKGAGASGGSPEAADTR